MLWDPNQTNTSLQTLWSSDHYDVQLGINLKWDQKLKKKKMFFFLFCFLMGVKNVCVAHVSLLYFVLNSFHIFVFVHSLL